jgi:hypothetical protein
VEISQTWKNAWGVAVRRWLAPIDCCPTFANGFVTTLQVADSARVGRTEHCGARTTRPMFRIS